MIAVKSKDIIDYHLYLFLLMEGLDIGAHKMFTK